jgi:dTDP-4-amino-4,6-dideoxygalactose transaminase
MSGAKRIPFVDLAAGVRPLREELLAAFAQVIDSAHFVGGPQVAEFERAFAARCGAPHGVAVKTGTDALLLALRALGVGPGDEVVTAANSFFATAEAIALAGARPVFADVRDEDLLLDPARVEECLTQKTRVVIPVHLYGRCADVEAIRSATAGHNVSILEDACQAHGAERAGRPAGSLADAAAFSFYPTKNLGALGEGGAVTTRSGETAARIRRLRDHGQGDKHRHDEVGTNARLDTLQCAALSIRLRHLDAAIAARRAVAERYRAALAGIDAIRLPPADDQDVAGVYHLFVVRVPHRDRVRAALGAAGVDTAIHYPTPIHQQPAFAHLGYERGDLPVTERAAGEILSLPMYPELPLDDVDRVAEALIKAVRG